MKYASILILVLLSIVLWPCKRYSALMEPIVSSHPNALADWIFDGDERPSEKAAEWALHGFEKLRLQGQITRAELLTIIDYSLPSDQKRMWILDMEKGVVLHHILVAHGRNSGELMAHNFSNVPGSYTSSLGFFITGETYTGKHGLSLVLEGLEAGINDLARERAIVMHAADYATKQFAEEHGRLGRSLGCPAIPPAEHEEVIRNLSGGSCLFIYGVDDSYIEKSEVIGAI